MLQTNTRFASSNVFKQILVLLHLMFQTNTRFASYNVSNKYSLCFVCREKCYHLICVSPKKRYCSDPDNFYIATIKIIRILISNCSYSGKKFSHVLCVKFYNYNKLYLQLLALPINLPIIYTPICLRNMLYQSSKT